MKLIIQPTQQLNGQATPPGSKSHTVRGLLLATLAKGTSHLSNALDSDDAQAAIQVCKNLGATIGTVKQADGSLSISIQSNGVPLTSLTSQIHTRNSGITTTFTLPILGLRSNAEAPLTLTCGEQMMKRPLQSIIDAVNNLGVTATSQTGSCPIQISGTLDGGYTTVNGDNSQYLSALLMALPCASKDSKIEVQNLQERPYIDMTLSWLEEQNIRFDWSKHENEHGIIDTFRIFGNQQYKPFTKTIPGDFSSASYLIAAAALLPGHVAIKGLNMQDSQGDKRLISILQQMGADIKITSQGIEMHGGKPLKGAIIDANDIPDMVPTLAVIATQAEGTTQIINAGHARIKETDRLRSMATELAKMGVQVEEKETSLIIHKSKLYRSRLHGYSDHRTIMALAIAALLAHPNPDFPALEAVEIDTAEGLHKTFPNFVEVMNSLGAAMKLFS